MEYDIEIDTFGDKRCYKKRTKTLHREDGPTIECKDGHKAWFINGLRHRIDGPAVEHSNGDKEWFINGKRHREDGPAVETPLGTKEWWINGDRLSPEKEAILNEWWNKKNGIQY